MRSTQPSPSSDSMTPLEAQYTQAFGETIPQWARDKYSEETIQDAIRYALSVNSPIAPGEIRSGRLKDGTPFKLSGFPPSAGIHK